MSSIRRTLTTLAAGALLGACAHAPQTREAAADTHAVVAGAPLADPGQKFRVPNRETGRRAKAAYNAEFILRMEADENGPPTAAQIFRAHEQRRALLRAAPPGLEKSAGLLPSQWQALGPSNVGGRVRAIAFDPSATARILAGTASGGLWHSEDGGTTWRGNQDFLPNLSVTTIAFDPVNPRNVYLGTGESSGGLVGVGVFRSADGGATWQYLAVTNPDANPDWRFVNRLAVHPSQPSILLAALTNDTRTLGAIYRSSDSGTSWTKVSSLKTLDIAFDPNNPSNALAGLDNGKLAWSSDAGATWTQTSALVSAPSGRQNTARAEIAFARSQPGLAYTVIDNQDGELWRSSDSGRTWEQVSVPGHLNKQGDYDNAIWVDPTNAGHVVVAGLDVHQSRDGGVTFTKVSDWRNAPASPHADHHALVSPPNFGPANPVLYNGNDGGIYRSPNINTVTTSTWNNMNNGLAVTQFYSGAGRTAAGGRVIGGTQDNGSLQLRSGVWSFWRGGDGGAVAVDPASDMTMYGEYVYLAVFRSTNGGASSTYICEGITEGMASEGSNNYCGADATKKANFIAPMIMDPNSAQRILGGAASLWVTDDARAAAPAWRTIKAPSAVASNYISAIAVAEGNGNVIWVGHNNGEVYRTLNGLSATPTWTRMGQGTIHARAVQRITIDRADSNHVIVSLTGFVANNVWETRDAGASWHSIHGNLPMAPVFDVKRHPANPSWLYAATSVGVFTSEDGGINWSTTNEGPANIRVRELFWIDDTTLGAATYGRGMFKVTVAGGGPANYQDLWWAGSQENGWGMSITQHGATLFVAFYIYDAQGQPLWVVMPGGTWNAGFSSYSGSLYIPSGSWFGNYDASRFIANNSVGSATLAFTSPSTATLSYTINGISGTKAISRNAFGVADATPVATYGDLWWGGTAQNGWGVAINQQSRTLFSVWYTYDSAGKTTWYVIPGGTWTAANTFTGTVYRTSGSAWLGTAYNAAALNALPVGTATFNFTDIGNATMSYTVDGVTGSKPLVRQPF
jgi:hypothetical protein